MAISHEGCVDPRVVLPIWKFVATMSKRVGARPWNEVLFWLDPKYSAFLRRCARRPHVKIEIFEKSNVGILEIDGHVRAID